MPPWPRSPAPRGGAQGFASTAPGFPEEEYRQLTRTTYEEIAARTNAVADRLLGRFVRALGTRDKPEMRELLD